MQQLEDVHHAIHGCTHIEGLVTVMQALANRLGYAGFSYADMSHRPLPGEPKPFSRTTLRADFLAAYRSENFIYYDPAMSRAAATNTPFTWADCPGFHEHRSRRRGRKTKAWKVMELVHDFGYTQGLVIPAHARDRQGKPASAPISLVWARPLKQFGTPDTSPWWLRWAVQAFHERMLELRGSTSSHSHPPPRPSLTDRECEVLAWACRGKTSGDTAEILRISERTVEFHLQNAMNKLGVHSKVHAAMEAFRLGLIAP